MLVYIKLYHETPVSAFFVQGVLEPCGNAVCLRGGIKIPQISNKPEIGTPLYHCRRV